VEDEATSHSGMQACLPSNARDASPYGCTVDVTNGSNNRLITLNVTDRGSGNPRAQQNRIFEPFFPTKDPGNSVTVESPTDTVSQNGTRVIVTFPCYDPTAQAIP
jgi:signal transduction histidine kinase